MGIKSMIHLDGRKRERGTRPLGFLLLVGKFKLSRGTVVSVL